MARGSFETASAPPTFCAAAESFCGKSPWHPLQIAGRKRCLAVLRQSIPLRHAQQQRKIVCVRQIEGGLLRAIQRPAEKALLFREKRLALAQSGGRNSPLRDGAAARLGFLRGGAAGFLPAGSLGGGVALHLAAGVLQCPGGRGAPALLDLR